MSEEIVKVIKIDTAGSEQTVKGLKEEINNLRDALLNVEKGGSEYKDILGQLVEDQKKLTDVMNAGKGGAEAAAGSYNALVNEMAALKKVWRETTDEGERNKLGEQIKDINDKLKGFDAGIGNYQRNVGNYSQSITEAFSSMGGAAKGMVGPINTVNGALKKLIANPVGAVIAAIAVALNAIIKGFKSSEENMNKLSVAFSGFKAIGDAVTKVFQTVASAIGDLANGVVNLLDKWGLLGDKFKERQSIAEDEIKLAKTQRENIVKNADLEKEAAELKSKAEEKNKYTASERLKFIKEAAAKEEEIAKNEYNAYQQEYEIIKAKNALTDSTAEEKEAEAQAYANMIKAQTNYLNKTKEMNSKIVSFQNELTAETKNQRDTILSLEKEMLQQQYELSESGSEDQLRLAKELRKKELEITLSGLKEKLKDRETYLKAEKLAVEKYTKDITNIENNALQTQIDNRQKNWQLRLIKTTKNTSEYYRVYLASMQDLLTKTEGRGKGVNQSEADYQLELQTIRENILSANDSLIMALQSEAIKATQTVTNIIKPVSQSLIVEYNNLLSVYNNLEQYSNESDNDFILRKQEMFKELQQLIINIYSGEEQERQNYIKVTDTLNGREWEGIKKLEEQYRQLDTVRRGTLNTIKDYMVFDADNLAENLKGSLMETVNQLGGGRFAEGWLKDILNTLGFSELSGITGEALKEIITSTGKTDEFQSLLRQSLDNSLLPQEMIDGYIDTLLALRDTEKEINTERYNNWQTLAQGIGDLMGGLADYYEADLEAQVDSGKITEEEAKKKYKWVKGAKIAQAIISTISGAIDAYMGCQSLGQPWGTILGATQAAAVTAAGAAQIRQIENTNPYDSSSSNLSTSSYSSASPALSEFQPQYTRNLTTQSDTDNLANAFGENPIRAYVVESEVSAAQEVANKKNQETTW